jgi:hypothetical protein
MKSFPHLSSQDGPGRVQAEGEDRLRNRKVVGFKSLVGSFTLAYVHARVSARAMTG